ncbi:ribosomal subunit interface protein [Diaminobutyricimonas aerilata]|uniref:Ribosome hibernation promoting factor n=1 Tax=Diaminobutyricimonas aerilata TaxID=1162967 RepID=A0A2M9CH71_9MICO|nr:ribosome-associated translation inhibitor RaiA [Diaminobutyricimonas aerilata]PJJ71263.1 ribosomal subunit interface protein [Diaminobutyricimonas aerilata]
MDVFITGRNVDITDRFQDYATEKSEKIANLADKAIAFEVRASRHAESRGFKGDDRVELTVICPGPLVRAEAEGADKYVAFDLAMDKLVERLRQAKDRKKVHHGQHRPPTLRQPQNGEFRVADIVPASVDVIERVATGAIPVQVEEEQEDYSPVVIRRKVFPSEHMTVESAVDRMELVGHDFFLFVDSETDRPSVVYRRKGWDYGVISLEEQPADDDDQGRRRRR